MPLPAGFYMRFEVFTVQSLSDLCMCCVWKCLKCSHCQAFASLKFARVYNESVCDLWCVQFANVKTKSLSGIDTCSVNTVADALL